MKTEHQLAMILKEMMGDRPLDDISVLALTKKCHVNRQTFYYHFHDIYNLLAMVFLDEKIQGINEVKNADELVKTIYEYYEKNEKFINGSLSSAGKDLVLEFFYNNCYSTFLRIINQMDTNKELHVNDKKVIARFYASAYSYSITYYLSNYKHKSLEGMKNNFSFRSKDDIQKSITNSIKNRKKMEELQ